MSTDTSAGRLSVRVAHLAEWLGIDRLRDSPAGARLFEGVYWFYKSNIEAREARSLADHVPPGSVVLDIGANLGFFTRLFVERTECAAVVAVEPEARNVAALRRSAARWGRDRVRVVEAAVADSTGTMRLRVDARNHADHQLAEEGADEGVEVRSVRLDDLVDELGLTNVGMVKIDVQGAEERVLRGSRQLLERDRPALFVEIDPAHLDRQGSSASAVLGLLHEHRYSLALVRRSSTTPCSPAEVLAAVDERGYLDVLCLPDP